MKRSRRIIQLPGPRLGRTRGLARFCDVPGCRTASGRHRMLQPRHAQTESV